MRSAEEVDNKTNCTLELRAIMTSHIGIYLSAYLRGLTDERRDCLEASDITPPPPNCSTSQHDYQHHHH